MVGRTLSHYMILEETSRGSIGVVYRAVDLKLNREVALKVFPSELVADEERKARFIQEARAAAALYHPQSFSNNNLEIWVIPATGGAARQVTDHPATDWAPSWSPDGKWMAFFSTRSGGRHIWRVPADGGEPKQESEEEGALPRWSPDGNWIYFVGQGHQAGNLWAYRPMAAGRAS